MTQQDQRLSSRSSLDSTVEVVDIESGIGFRASGMDVSDNGLAFHAPMEPALGADMYVKLGETGVPAEFKVVRIEAKDKGFMVAATSRSRR